MIVITDSAKYCPEFPERIVVNSKSLGAISRDDVVAAFCSRAFAKQLLAMDFLDLKYIQLFSAGYDGIDLQLVKEKGITLCNAANVYNLGMSEFVVYAMLMAAKRYHRSIKNHTIRPLRNYHYITELYGKTVGIMGCGNIGCQIAKRLAAFDMNIVGYDAVTDDRPCFSKVYGLEERDAFVSQCDYLVNCIPLFPSTERLLDNRWFSKMKENITIVNVARKQTINDREFIQFLKSHKNATAVLDMLERIPNPLTNPYRRLNNVLVLPGVTAASNESMERLHELLLKNLDNFKNNLELLNVIKLK